MDGFDCTDDPLREIDALEGAEELRLRDTADAAVRGGKEPFDFETFRRLY